MLLLRCAVAALLAGGCAISTLLPLGSAISPLLPLRSAVAPLLPGGCTIAALLPLGGTTIGPLLAVLALPRLLLLPRVPALLRRRAVAPLLARLLPGTRLALLARESTLLALYQCRQPAGVTILSSILGGAFSKQSLLTWLQQQETLTCIHV